MDDGQIISVGISSIIFLTMVIVGLDVSPSDFSKLRKDPRPVLIGLLTQTLFVPVSLAFTSFVNLPSALEAGILLLAICPMGSIANLYVSVGKGNVALSVSLAMISGLLAFLTMPLWMSVFQRSFGEVFEFAVPMPTLLSQLFLMLALPIGVGMWLRVSFAKREPLIRSLCKRIALAGVLALGGYIIFQDSKGFTGGFLGTAAAAAVLSLLGMAASFAVAKCARLGSRDAVTLLLNSPVKNFGVAIAIAVNVLGQPEFALFATTTFMVQLPLFLLAAVLLRRAVGKTQPTHSNS